MAICGYNGLEETGLYYLQSRYYNPEWGRFINADGLVATGQGLTGNNMFAYCLNNPVMYFDSTGESAILVTLGIMAIGGVIGMAVSATTSAVTQQMTTGNINWKSVAVSSVSGFFSGAIAASPLGLTGQVVAGALIGGVTYLTDCYVNEMSVSIDEVAFAVVLGGISGLIGGPGANKGMVLTDAIESMGKTVARESRRANQKYAAKAMARALSYGKNILSVCTWDSSIRFAAGSGVSNGALGWYSSLDIAPNLGRLEWC